MSFTVILLSSGLRSLRVWVTGRKDGIRLCLSNTVNLLGSVFYVLK